MKYQLSRESGEILVKSGTLSECMMKLPAGANLSPSKEDGYDQVIVHFQKKYFLKEIKE